MPKEFLTVSEVAKILGVTPLTIRNWDRRGRLIAHRHPINSYRLYKVVDVENLLRELEASKGKTSRKPEEPIFTKLEIGEE